MQSVASAYADYLERDTGDPYLNGRFLLAYIDEDNVPEMIVSPLFADHYTGTKIFTYYNNEVIDLGYYGSFGMVMIGEKSGIIQSNWSGMGGYTNDFYRLSKGETDFISNLSEIGPLPAPSSVPEEPTSYIVDDVEVTQHVFLQKMSKLRSQCVFLNVGHDNGWEVTGNIDRLRNAPYEFMITRDNYSMRQAEMSDNHQLPGSGKHFTIVTDTVFRPFEYTDSNGNFVGIDVDLIRAIAESQGFTYDLKPVGWDSSIAACQAGQADGMIAGISMTDERIASGWIFSETYYTGSQCLVTSEGSDIDSMPDLRGKRVCVVTGTNGATYAESIAGTYDFTITYMEDPDQLFDSIRTGKSDAFFNDYAATANTIKEEQLDMRIVEETELHKSSYGLVVFSEEQRELIELFNNGLANIKASGEYYDILGQYLCS